MLTAKTLIALLGKEVTLAEKAKNYFIFGFSESDVYLMDCIIPIDRAKQRIPYKAMISRLSWKDESIISEVEELVAEQTKKSTVFKQALADYMDIENNYYKYEPSGLYDDSSDRGIIKYGGPGGNIRMDFWHINYVRDDDGETKYILNFIDRPKVQNNDIFFLAKSFPDRFNTNHVGVFARGTISIPDNIIARCKESWAEQIDWLKDRPWTVFVKDFELLRAPLDRCLYMDRVHAKYGKDIYEKYYGKKDQKVNLDTIHHQMSHIYLSSFGINAINKEFEKRAELVGIFKYDREKGIDTYEVSKAIEVSQQV